MTWLAIGISFLLLIASGCGGPSDEPDASVDADVGDGDLEGDADDADVDENARDGDVEQDAADGDVEQDATDGDVEQDAADGDPCSHDNGGCDPMTTCTSTTEGRICGPCPDSYSGDGESGCRCISTGAWPPEDVAVAPRDLPELPNIAAGAPYTLDPRPNYVHCTEEGDATQLTDGVYSVGYFWTQATTVGWTLKTPLITIDLGEERSIRGLSYNSAANVAGVTWPEAIYVFVADEEMQFRLVGDLVSMHGRHAVPPTDEYVVHRFWTDELRTHGRYLAVIAVGSPYIFVDEIEVFEGEPEWLEEPLSDESWADPSEAMSAYLTETRARRRFVTDMTTILHRAEEMGLDEVGLEEIVCEWDSVLAELAAFEPGPDFTTVLPLDLIHARVLSIQGRLWAEGGFPPLIVWRSGTWDQLPYLAVPPTDGEHASLRIDMMMGEHRATQLDLSNATERPRTVRLRVTGLHGGANPDWVTVHEAAWTDTVEGEPVSAALPEAFSESDAYVIRAPAGMTRQIWITAHPVDVPAGLHEGAVELDDGSETVTVPFTIELYPLRFPDERALHLGGWDYTNRVGVRAITEENRDLLIDFLREHFVDRPWALPSAMRRGSFDGDGHMTTEPDTSELDAWLEQWPVVDLYMVFVAVSDRIGSFTMGAPEFEVAVGDWATFWAAHFEASGVAPERVALLLVDEPHDPERAGRILAWAEAISASGADFLIWEDPTYRDMTEADLDMLDACDVLCPNRRLLLAGGPEYEDFFVRMREAGTTLEIYSCMGPVRHLDPYAYHRMQAWTAWRMGATAMYFWAFSDAGGASSWNEYALTSGRMYTPLFIDDTSVTTGKHMEAAREGIEDYQYLAMLRDAIEAAASRGVDASLVAEARELLTDAPERVHPPNDASMWWRDELDRTEADLARREILDMLERLGES